MRRKAVIAVVLAALLLCGCWDYRRISTVAFAMAMGIDDEDETGVLHVSLQFPVPGAIRGGGGGGAGGGAGGGGSSSSATGGGGQQFYQVDGRGPTFAEALSEVQRRLSRPISFGHLQVILISELAARRHEIGLFEQLWRFPELDKLSYLLVVQGGKASDALKVVPPQERLPALYLTTAMESFRTTRSVARPTTLTESMVFHAEPGRDLLVTALNVEDGQLRVDRVAVFRDTVLTTILSPDQSRAVLVALGEGQNLALSVPSPTGGLWAYRRVNASKPLLSVVSGQGGEQISVAVRLTGEAAGVVGERPGIDPDTLRAMEQRLSDFMESQIVTTVRKLQGLGVDPIGFYARSRPGIDGGQWRARYRKARVTATVSTALERKGVLH